jgi:DNA mismatch repair protein MutS2
MVGERLYEADELLAQIKEIFESKQMDGGDVINASTLRNRLENLKFQSESEAESRPEYTPATFEQVKVGAKVYVFSMGTEGEILSVNSKKKELSVAVGQMKLTLKAKDVAILQVKKQKEKPKRIQPVSQPKDVAPVKHVATEINLLGLRVDEALPEVDAFLDQAVMGGLEEVRIIHGLGTGRLKAGITQHLKGHPCVKEFRPGRYGEGSYGVTVVTLK